MRPMTSCLLLLFCMTLTCLGQELDLDIPEDADVTVSKKVSVMKNGKKFHSTRVLAKDCSQQYTKADFDDNTSSDVIDDLDDEISVILLSTSPDRCFVRDIKGAKSECLKGSTGGEKRQESGTVETEYGQGTELKLDDLPEGLRTVCEGRTVVKVHSVDDQGSDGHPLRKRDERVFRCATLTSCRQCCSGWVWGKRCNTCCTRSSACRR